jgi:hypothetical protein
MIQASVLFAKQILGFGGFKATALPGWVITVLLTAFSELLKQDVVIMEPLVKLAKRSGKGVLVVDDTTNPKYGLKNWSRKLKIVGTSGYEHGYKILLFLWECDAGRIPLGFALWHKESKPVNDLTLEGFSRLRNHYGLKPEAVLGDGAFSTDKILKRLEDYGWPTVMRCRNNRKVGKLRISKAIARGYGDTQGKLKNGVKVKIFRRKSRFFVCNRMLWDMQKALKLYKRRWKIEETFRALKTCIGLNRCQQHSMQAQTLYLLFVFLLFASLEVVSTDSVYKTAQAVISGQLPLENILDKTLFNSWLN